MYTVEEIYAAASSPQSPPETLAYIAQHYPECRPLIAANPATYPELKLWLASLDDPQINSVLHSAPVPVARGRKARNPLAVGAIVLAVVAVVAGIGFFAATFLQGSGAKSPEAAAENFFDAMADGDLVALVKTLSPAEVGLTVEAARIGTESASTETPAADLNRLLDAISIGPLDVEYRIHSMSPTISLIEVDRWDVDISYTSDAAEALFDQYDAVVGGTLPLYIQDEIRYSFRNREWDFSGDVVEELSYYGGSPRFIAVKEKGGWYISYMMSAAETAYDWMRKADLPLPAPNYDADYEKNGGSKNPIETVEGAVESVQDDLGEFNWDLLAFPERRVGEVYLKALTDFAKDEFLYLPNRDTGLSGYLEANLELVSKSFGDYQIVSLGSSSFLSVPLYPDYPLISVEFDAGRIDVASDREWGYTLDLNELVVDPEQVGLVMKKEDGRWVISTVLSAVNILTPEVRDPDAAEARAAHFLVDAEGYSQDLAESLAAIPLFQVLTGLGDQSMNGSHW